MFDTNDGQDPKTSSANNAETHSQLPPAEENQIPAAEPTKAELVEQPSNTKFTGPRSEIGKKRSSRNAIKSGLFAKATLLPGESRAEYESLRQRFWKAKQPGDGFEEVLFEMIVSNVWRQLRVQIVENAEIRMKSDFRDFDQLRSEEAEAQRIIQSGQPGAMEMVAFQAVALILYIYNPLILQRCIELLGELRMGIKTNGFDEEEDGPILRRIYGDPSDPHYRHLLNDEYSILRKTAIVPEEEKEGYLTPQECKQRILREISMEIKRLEQYQRQQELIESKRSKVGMLLRLVPDSSVLERLLRSRNSLEREFYRLLAQYERAQRIRKGQPLPPEVDVKISS
jgi:hypothetical protein